MLGLITAILMAACPGIVGLSMPSSSPETWQVWRSGSSVLATQDQCAISVVEGAVVTAALSMPDTGAGLQITSTSNSALNGTYPVDTATQQKLAAVSLYVAVNGHFPAGLQSIVWSDVTGAPHAGFTMAQHQAFATVIADYITGIDAAKIAIVAGHSVSWPSSSVTIP